MKTSDKNRMKKIYSRPMVEMEELMGIQLLIVDSLRVFTPEDETNQVSDHDDLLSDQSNLWDKMEDNLQ